MTMIKWHSIALDPFQLRLSVVLRCGQSFRWRNVDGIWSIGLKNRILLVRQDEKSLYYASLGQGLSELSDEELVRDYFQLHVDMKVLYKEWKKDKRFDGQLQGVRILRQDPWETLCAFICSSNNNIKRISKMVHSLCVEYGPYIGSHAGQEYHDFPTPDALAVKGVEERLRELGFGYRAKYIAQTARKVAEMKNGLDYLHELRETDYIEARHALQQFSGVGPKVADCVCLMALDKTECVPVDTHVWQIARRDYKMKFKENAQGYLQVQTAFKELWGDYAGWAHSVLFAGDLSDLENGINIDSTKAELKVEKLEQVTETAISVTEIKTETIEVKVEV